MASTIKVNNIQNQCGANIANKCGSTITLGASGDTITLACGASQTGFGRTGTVDWDTTAKTASFTAVSGNGYFVNTTSGAITLTLPASPSAGDIVAFKDYAGTFGTNNLTIARNGSNLDGSASDKPINTNHTSMSLVYVDATQGWKSVEEGTGYIGEAFISATGGTIVCCGDYRTHIFTGPGSFTVSEIASCSANNEIDYVVIAGGGGGAGALPASGGRGGGGAGGFRISNSLSLPAPLTSPLANTCGVTVAAQSYPITVGGGGGGGPASCSDGTKGSDSIFSTITSTGGGRGNAYPSCGSPGSCAQQNGGSGGGAYSPPTQSQGTGNTPPVSPPQGNPALAFPGSSGGSGGGGAGASPPATSPNVNSGSAGGAGSYIDNNFIGPTAPSYGETGPVGSTRYFSGGGGGGSYEPCGTQLPGGVGGGGDGGNGNASIPTTAGTTNTGGGGGGGGGGAAGGSGGSGIVIIRYKYQ